MIISILFICWCIYCLKKGVNFTITIKQSNNTNKKSKKK